MGVKLGKYNTHFSKQLYLGNSKVVFSYWKVIILLSILILSTYLMLEPIEYYALWVATITGIFGAAMGAIKLYQDFFLNPNLV